jgi:hypothetical protein
MFFFFLVILMNETFFHKKNIVSCNVLLLGFNFVSFYSTFSSSYFS